MGGGKATGGVTGTGGVSASGGTSGTTSSGGAGGTLPGNGGAPSNGGTASSGGSKASGGALPGTGGATSTGGTTSPGGSKATGGTTGGGGIMGTGGTGAGGVSGVGGATGTGGSTSNICGGKAGVSCPSGKFCDLESKCGQIADASGTCMLTGPGLGCTADVNPVCGCDGKTYSNDCMRAIAGVLKASDGACPSRDGGATTSSTAWLAWQAPGGVAGTGAAVVVGGSGFIDTWNNVASFSPETPPSNANTSSNLTRAQTDDLFARLASVSFSSLPHATSTWAECESMFYYRACQGCTAVNLKYIFPSQASPEMDSVWLWFDQVLGATANTNPRNFCNFK